MASVKELRVRIKSVGNIKQITRAMEMVASTKLRRFQDRAVSSRPYAEEIAGLVENLAGVLGGEVENLPLFNDGAGSKIAVLLVSSDRGLCGAYNSNLFLELERWIKARKEEGLTEADVDFFVYGRKGFQYLSKRSLNVERFLVDPPLEAVSFAQAAATARDLVTAFLSGEYRRVELCFTAFESMVKYVPRVVSFLPIAPPASADAGAGAESDVILEPDAETIFDSLVPRYLETRIYNALLESLTSEYASRRVSMKAATDAATDMQKILKGQYNRLRQEGITKELLDIVGGVEALK
ncbi:MAG: ATP synthase F1 subunit gamma [Planctomycetes bacterium]|nr:ATP synthase F1 subunit gamma [Planctomycetota bacterium]